MQGASHVPRFEPVRRSFSTFSPLKFLSTAINLLQHAFVALTLTLLPLPFPNPNPNLSPNPNQAGALLNCLGLLEGLAQGSKPVQELARKQVRHGAS